jgi:GxxExxY protein
MQRGLCVAAEVPVPVRYADTTVEAGLRLDILVEDSRIVEAKAVEHLHRVHAAQALTYLRLTNRRLGILLNFNAFPLAIRRLVNSPQEL